MLRDVASDAGDSSACAALSAGPAQALRAGPGQVLGSGPVQAVRVTPRLMSSASLQSSMSRARFRC